MVAPSPFSTDTRAATTPMSSESATITSAIAQPGSRGSSFDGVPGAGAAPSSICTTFACSSTPAIRKQPVARHRQGAVAAGAGDDQLRIVDAGQVVRADQHDAAFDQVGRNGTA